MNYETLGDKNSAGHQALIHASEEKRMLDMSRAAVTLRICMAAFMMAYLIQPLTVSHDRGLGIVSYPQCVESTTHCSTGTRSTSKEKCIPLPRMKTG